MAARRVRATGAVRRPVRPNTDARPPAGGPAGALADAAVQRLDAGLDLGAPGAGLGAVVAGVAQPLERVHDPVEREDGVGVGRPGRGAAAPAVNSSRGAPNSWTSASRVCHGERYCGQGSRRSSAVSRSSCQASSGPSRPRCVAPAPAQRSAGRARPGATTQHQHERAEHPDPREADRRTGSRPRRPRRSAGCAVGGLRAAGRPHGRCRSPTVGAVGSPTVTGWWCSPGPRWHGPAASARTAPSRSRRRTARARRAGRGRCRPTSSSPTRSGTRKPTATRAGMPSSRAITAIAAANCSQ